MIKLNAFKFLFLALLFSIGTIRGYSQKNYFYTSVKVPLGDYVLYLITDDVNDNENAKHDGALFDFGYGIQVKEWFAVETGAEAFFFNPLTKRYYHPSNRVYDELDVTNKAFSLQIRPTVTMELGDDISFRASYAANYRQMSSSGTYYSNQAQNNGQGIKNTSSARSTSKFSLNFQPSVGLDFKLNDDWALGFDFTYIRVKWNKSLDGLTFKNQPDLMIPDHRTSNLFLSGRIIFK